MALSACRTSARLTAILACLAAGAACSRQAPRPAVLPGSSPDPAVSEVGVELPPGAGRNILLNACLGCHDLGGLVLFDGFYTRERWQELVLTMVAQGASVDPVEVDVLADYLALYFGPD